MASIANEIESIALLAEPLFTASSVYYQRVPTEPSPSELSIRFISSSSDDEASNHYRLERDYQIIYFAENELACLQKMEALERELNKKLVIPLKDSTRFMRVLSFSFSQPFRTESGNAVAIIGILNAAVREGKDLTQYTKIGQIGVTTYSDSNVSTWEVIDGGVTVDNPNDGFTWDEVESGTYFFKKE